MQEVISLSDPTIIGPAIKKESGFGVSQLFAQTIADKLLDLKGKIYYTAEKNAIKKHGSNPTKQAIEAELLLQKAKVAQVLFNGFATVKAMGATPDDSDRIYLVPRDGCLTVVTNVELFRRCAARKGYLINTDLIAIPAADANKIYTKEIVVNGEFRQQIIDESENHDRTINSKRLLGNYFNGFLIRTTVKAKNGRLIAEKAKIVSIDDVLAARNKAWGTNDPSSVWNVWTTDMVEKVCFRKAFKTIVEMLPELSESFYQFGKIEDAVVDDIELNTKPVESEPIMIEVKTDAEFQAQVADLIEEYKANPKLALNHAEEIDKCITDGWTLADIVAKYDVALEGLAISQNPEIIAVLEKIKELKSKESK